MITGGPLTPGRCSIGESGVPGRPGAIPLKWMRESFFRIAPWLLATFALMWMFGLRAVTVPRLVRIFSCSSPRLPKDVPEATTYRTGSVMSSSTGPSSRSREIRAVNQDRAQGTVRIPAGPVRRDERSVGPTHQQRPVHTPGRENGIDIPDCDLG